MNEINKQNKLTQPKLVKEKLTGVWKIVFRFLDLNGKTAKWTYSQELNNKDYFQFDSNGVKKVDNNGVILKNVKQRERIAKQIIADVENWQDNLIFNVVTKSFMKGDTDRTITDLVEEYITHKVKEGKAKQASINQYISKKNGFKKYIEDCKLPNYTLTTFTKANLIDFYAYLLQDIQGVKKAFSRRYRDDYHRFFIALYNYLIKYKELEIKDITRQIPFLVSASERTTTHRATDKSNINALIKDIQAYKYYLGLLFEFSFYTMHRIETLTAIQLEDIDIKNGKIIIPSHKMKTGVQCTISIEYTILPTILEYLNDNKTNPKDYLFGRNEHGEVQLFGAIKSRANTFSSQFASYRKNAILRNFELVDDKTTLYSAKHSGVKRLLDEGYTANQIISITGHTSIDQLGTYAKDYKPKPLRITRVTE